MVSWSVTGKESLLTILARKAKARKVAITHAFSIIIRLLLMLAGFGSIAAAALMIAIPLGLFTIGVLLLVFEWVVKR